MKTFITAAALALATLTSFAQEATRAPEFDNFVSMRTRAEVRAELQAALAAGWRPSQGEASYAPEFGKTSSTRTRADARAEVAAAIARGERLSYGEAGPDPQQAQRIRASSAATLAARPTMSAQ
jgi:Domain of unknown function (DUF4148)